MGKTPVAIEEETKATMANRSDCRYLYLNTCLARLRVLAKALH